MIIPIKQKDSADETKWHRKFIFLPKKCFFDDRHTNCWAMLTFVWRKKKLFGHNCNQNEWKWTYRTTPPPPPVKNNLNSWSE